MVETGKNDHSSLTELEKLSARWDKIVFHAQGSPFEDLSISCLAKNTACRPWSRASAKIKGDTLARYIYLSFEELLEIEKLDLKQATHLLEICESTMLFMQESYDMGSLDDIDSQAATQRMRFVEEYGLYQDFPIALANLDTDMRELCQAEEVITLIDLMGFIDRLTEKAWIGGSCKSLQNVFAHGDEKGLCEYFPYRMGHRGFHLPEALSFCLNRLSTGDLHDVLEYHERRRKKSRFGAKPVKMPRVVETQLLEEIFQCLSYFGRRQPKLMINLHDSAYVSRELMFLNDPQTEGILYWLLHLAMGIFRPSMHQNINEDLSDITVDRNSKLHKELEKLLGDE
ncbi:hypothetical protein DDZ13_03225 [Coraliomargarita sinensis]|uniref:Uncharacterized protein n=1 Tax=Coraliomargarita sinensis TaxID=2174842 RepID=A0A317ZNM0_9BACT|nr:hypothetical protein [Coraliomargarita sinensis]PXA04991.1 hypothetical protein DDZ13_03225 [Coraliomargarita sinensis]